MPASDHRDRPAKTKPPVIRHLLSGVVSAFPGCYIESQSCALLPLRIDASEGKISPRDRIYILSAVALSLPLLFLLARKKSEISLRCFVENFINLVCQHFILVAHNFLSLLYKNLDSGEQTACICLLLNVSHTPHDYSTITLKLGLKITVFWILTFTIMTGVYCRLILTS